MTTLEERAPYDDADHERAVRYLEKTGRQLFDPFGLGGASDDPYFGPSLAAARQQMQQAFQTRRQNGEPFRVYPAFIDKPDPNAMAIDLGGLHLCGLHCGMASAVFELAAFSFSQKSFFFDVGDPAAEENPALPLEAQLCYWISDRVFARDESNRAPIGEELIPVDLERRLMAHFLSQMMMRFAWFHELFHGLNGHSGLIRSRNKDLELHEMPDELGLVEMEEQDIAAIPWERAIHCLEFDADRSAFWTMIRLQQTDSEPFEVLAGKPQLLRLRLVTVAAFLMTFLFDQSAKRRALKNSKTHPPAYSRLHNLIGTIASNLEDPPGQMQQVLSQVFLDLKRLRDRVPSLVDPDGLMAELASSPLQRALDTMDADLNVVRTQTAPFAYR